MFECPVHGLVPSTETMSGLPGPYGSATLHWAEGNHCGKPLHWITVEVAQAVVDACAPPPVGLREQEGGTER